MRTVNLLLIIIAATAVAITTIRCSKSSTSNTPVDRLTAHPWKLQKIDTIFHDANGNPTDTSVIMYGDCATRPNTLFSRDHIQHEYIGCSTPLSFPSYEYNWNLGGDRSNILTVQNPIRSGSPYVTIDSVITLTADSLVLQHLQTSPYNIPQNDYTRSLLIHRWFTR